MRVVFDEGRPRRRRENNLVRIVLVTTKGRDGHTHCAIFDGNGNGTTSQGPDGHTHEVVELDVLPARGHTHGLTEVRCPRPHNLRAHGNHPRSRDA